MIDLLATLLLMVFLLPIPIWVAAVAADAIASVWDMLR